MSWDNFRKEWPRNVVICWQFVQEDQLKDAKVVEIDLSPLFSENREKQKEDVGKGVCRQLCRMWVFFRNVELANGAEGEQPPDLKHLKQHLKTIAVSQALNQAGVVDSRAPIEVFGLTGTLTHASTVGGIYDKVTASTGCLSISIVELSKGGTHAIAFDGRGDSILIFDPNWGRLEMKKNARSVKGRGARDMFKDYISFTKYKPLFLYRYSRL
jgi:hypothetical protein